MTDDLERFPEHLVTAAGEQGRAGWLERLPAIVHDLVAQWSLEIERPFQPGGQTSWVAPARRPNGAAVVLKVLWRHYEADHEAEGLRAWNGDGAVMLHESAVVDDETAALLMERCDPGTVLKSRPEAEQDEVVARLLRRLWKPPSAPHPFRPLQSMCDAWADELERKVADGHAVIDPGLVRDGIALFRGLPASAEREVLLCTDLHGDNILAAQREPWLVIDPKPYVGDPCYDPLQHMLNCGDRLRADPGDLCNRLADLTGLPRERLRLWLFARCVQEAPHWDGLLDVARAIAPT